VQTETAVSHAVKPVTIYLIQLSAGVFCSSSDVIQNIYHPTNNLMRP
jgi:hypothetical protein